MKDYVKVIKNEKAGSISVCFYIEQDKVLQIGKEMQKINEQALMNGYNWEAVLNFYLDNNHPMVAGGMGADSEAGMFVAFYKLTPANEKKAEQLAGIIEDLVENESKLYEMVKENADEIEWD
jgi:hypothetical protein